MVTIIRCNLALNAIQLGFRVGLVRRDLGPEFVESIDRTSCGIRALQKESSMRIRLTSHSRFGSLLSNLRSRLVPGCRRMPPSKVLPKHGMPWPKSSVASYTAMVHLKHTTHPVSSMVIDSSCRRFVDVLYTLSCHSWIFYVSAYCSGLNDCQCSGPVFLYSYSIRHLKHTSKLC